MYVMMKCVAEAIAAKGVRGLAEMVPGGSFLFDVANDALRRMKDRRRADQLRDEVLQAAAASADEARQVAERVAREVAAGGSAEDRLTLELYLTQVPGAVRQSLRRADDPAGKSVPDHFALNDPADLVKRLPAKLPRFRPGDALPGKPGWELAELIGTGGFGEVWLARNPALAGLKGAVKFGTDPEARGRLLRHEGAMVSRVMEHGRHPNVVQLLDAHLAGDAPWLMYEYVGGGDLTGLIHAWQGVAPEERARRTAAALKTLAAAVGHFHRLSPPLVHRDLKPSNILLDPAKAGGGRAAVLKVADFGIGGVAAASAISGATGGALLSQLEGSYTPLYASPQQTAGGPPDPRDDVHALGVIGYQILTGRLDATLGADYARTLRKLGVPDPLIELLGDCAAHDPDHRPKDAAALADRLGRLAASPPAATTASPPAAAPPAAPQPAAAPSGETKVPIPCPQCRVALQVADGETRLTRCPMCGHMFRPFAPPAPPPAPPAPAEIKQPSTVIKAEAAPSREREPVRRRQRWDEEYDEDDRPRRRKGRTRVVPVAAIVGGVIAAAVFIALVVLLVRSGRRPPEPVPEGKKTADATAPGDAATPGATVTNPFAGGPAVPPPAPSTAQPVVFTGEDAVPVMQVIGTRPQAYLRALEVVYSPTGGHVAVVSDSGMVHLFSANAGGKPIKEIFTGVMGHRPAFTRDGLFLATAVSTGSDIHLHPVAGGEPTVLPGLAPDRAGTIAVSPDGRWLAADGAGQGAVRVWDLNSAGRATSFPLPSRSNAPARTEVGGSLANVEEVVFDPTGKYLAVTFGREVRAWRAAGWPADTGAVEPFVRATRPTAIAFGPTGKLLTIGGEDGSVALRDMDNPAVTNVVGPARSNLKRVVQLACSPNGHHLAALDETGNGYLWDYTRASTQTLPFTWHGAVGRVNAIAFNPEGSLLATAGDDRKVMFWDGFWGKPLAGRWVTGTSRVQAFAFSPDGNRVALVSESGSMVIWSVPNFKRKY